MNCKHCNAEWTPPANVPLTSCPFCQKPLIELSNLGDNTRPDEILLEITQIFGLQILGDKRLSSILKDYMPNIEKKYLRIFSQAVVDGIGVKLLELQNEETAIRTLKIHTLKDTFRNNNGFDQTAVFVINCFLFALGWISSTEVDSYDISSTEKIKPENERFDVNNFKIPIGLKGIVEAMVEGFVIDDENFEKQMKWLENYCQNEKISFSELEKNVKAFFYLLAEYKETPSDMLKHAIFKKAYQFHLSKKFLDEVLFAKKTEIRINKFFNWLNRSIKPAKKKNIF